MSFGSSSIKRMMKVGWFMALRLRKFDPEPASLSLYGLQAGPSAHLLHGLAHDRQADAASRILGRRAEALENSEDALLVFRPDSDPVVLDPEPHRSIPVLRADPDRGGDAGGDELDRI